jgi:hypothetical protein
MSLTTPFRVQKLQTALHAKAKESPNFRFHALYDKVYRKDVLAFAYERCKANGGAAGVDNQTFENIEAYGRERWLDELAQELKSRTYQPLPVRLDEEGPSLPRHDTFEETSAAHLSSDQRRNRTRQSLARFEDRRGQAQSDVDRLGQLLLSGASQQSLQCGRHARTQKAASVVMRQTQRAAAGI